MNVGVKVDSKNGCSSSTFRHNVSTQLIPKLLAFNPDLLFISAGFDGHADDLIGQCQYTDDDFRWVTQELMSVANLCCDGKVVSVLEGGYNTRAGYLSPFARCVRQHVRTLMNHDTKARPDELVAQLPGEKERRAQEAYIAEEKRRRVEAETVEKESEEGGSSNNLKRAASGGLGEDKELKKTKSSWWTDETAFVKEGGTADGW